MVFFKRSKKVNEIKQREIELSQSKVILISEYFLLNQQPEDYIAVKGNNVIGIYKLSALVYLSQWMHKSLYNKDLVKLNTYRRKVYLNDKIVDGDLLISELVELYEKDLFFYTQPKKDNLNIDFSLLTTKEKEFLDKVFKVFGKFTGKQLYKITKDVEDGLLVINKEEYEFNIR